MAFAFKPKQQATPKPEFTGIQGNTASSSVAICVGWGANRIAINCFWAGDFVTTEQTEHVGKGFGGASSTTYTYSASVIMGLCAAGGAGIVGVRNIWRDKDLFAGTNAYATLGFSLFVGTLTQAPWSYLTTAHPADAYSYHGVAYLAQANYSLGNSATLGNHTVEVLGRQWDSQTGTQDDADPALVIQEFLYDSFVGVNPSLSAIVDNSTLAAGFSVGSDMQVYCRALGLGINPFLSNQEAASSILGRWCQLMNTAPVWTGFSLKFVPYGDESVTANGVTYNPPTTSRYTLTDTDFRDSGPGDDPVKVKRADPALAKNSVAITFKNRLNSYNQEPCEIRDQNAVELYGLIPDSTVQADEICLPDVANTIVALWLQRSVHQLNTFEFGLGPEYCLLEPGDVVTLTFTDAGAGYTIMPVRLTRIAEQDDDSFDCEAEEFAQGVGSAATYARQHASGASLVTNNPPGHVNTPVIFEPRSDLSGGAPEIWIGLSGGDNTTAGADWGGAQVWASWDNNTFSPIGQVKGQGIQGKLTATLAAYGGANPDNTNTLHVDFAESGQALDSVTALEASAGSSLCLQGAELLSYQTAVSTGGHAENLTTLYRGLYGTTAGAHAAGETLFRLDSHVFRWALPSHYVGHTVYFKFPSFNTFGQEIEDLADLTSIAYTPTGQGFYVPPSHLTGVAAVAGNVLTWTAPVQPGVSGYRIYATDGPAGLWSVAVPIGSTVSNTWTHAGLNPGDVWTYWVTAFSNQWGTPDGNPWESVPSNSFDVTTARLPDHAPPAPAPTAWTVAGPVEGETGAAPLIRIVGSATDWGNARSVIVDYRLLIDSVPTYSEWFRAEFPSTSTELKINVGVQGQYDVRVRYRNFDGTEDDATFLGLGYVQAGDPLLSPLPDIVDLTDAYIAGITKLIWAPVTDFRLPDFELRRGPTWETGVFVIRTKETSVSATSSDTYWLATHYTLPNDRGEMYGAPSMLVIAGSQLVKNVVATRDEAGTGWTGALNNAVVVGGAVQLLGSADILVEADVLTLADVLYDGGVTPSGSYTIPVGHRIDVGRVAACVVVMTTTVRGESIFADVLTLTDILIAEDILDISLGQLVTAIPQIRLSQDGIAWGDWQNWVPGSYSAQVFDARVVLTTSDPTVTPILSAFLFKVDAPDRVDSLIDQDVANTGLAYTYAPPYNGGPGGSSKPQVQVTILDAVDGDMVKLSTTSAGFTLYIRNGGVNVERNCNIFILGY